MSVRAGQAVTVNFTTQDTSGAATDADSTPTGTVYVSGTSNAAAVTVTNITTGLYSAAFTVPDALAPEDTCEVVISATVGGTAAKGIVWRDSYDPVLVISQSGL